MIVIFFEFISVGIIYGLKFTMMCTKIQFFSNICRLKTSNRLFPERGIQTDTCGGHKV